MIRIKDLRIFENANEKENSQVYSFDTITFSEYLPNNHISKIKSLSSSISALISESATSLPVLISFLPYITLDIGKPTTTRSKRVFQSPKHYDTKINTNIKALLSQLIKIINIINYSNNI